MYKGGNALCKKKTERLFSNVYRHKSPVQMYKDRKALCKCIQASMEQAPTQLCLQSKSRSSTRTEHCVPRTPSKHLKGRSGEPVHQSHFFAAKVKSYTCNLSWHYSGLLFFKDLIFNSLHTNKTIVFFTEENIAENHLNDRRSIWCDW